MQYLCGICVSLSSADVSQGRVDVSLDARPEQARVLLS